MKQVLPELTLLSPEQIEQVHAYSLRLLSKTGIRVESPQARAIFSRALPGCLSGDRVLLPAEAVEKAIKTAPSSIEIFRRDRLTSLRLDADRPQTYFGIGVTNLWYQDPQTDAVAPFRREHMQEAVRLGETLGNYDLISTPGVIQDIASDRAEAYGTLEMIANTTKPLILLVSSTEQFSISLKLAEFLTGELSSRPFLVPYFNPVTPLVLNKDTSDKILLTIEAGLPFIYSCYGMSGASAPIGAAGTLVTLNAELLAGLVFSQLVREGTPVILGQLPSFFDMKNMTSAYTTQTLLLNLACAEMMAHYRIPHAGTSGSGSGWGPDLLASGTLWLNHLTCCLGKAGLVPFVGGNLDSLAFSPTTVIYGDEIIRQVRLFARGFDLDDESVALSEIDSAGPGGSFLMAGQTLDLFRKMHEQHSSIWPGYSLEKWQAEKSPQAVDLLRRHAGKILSSLQVPADHNDLIERGEAFLNKAFAKELK